MSGRDRRRACSRPLALASPAHLQISSWEELCRGGSAGSGFSAAWRSCWSRSPPFWSFTPSGSTRKRETRRWRSCASTRRWRRRFPVAVVREKLEHGKEAQREKISGPAQAQVDERAFPARLRHVRPGAGRAPGIRHAVRRRAGRQLRRGGPVRPARPARGHVHGRADDELRPRDRAGDRPELRATSMGCRTWMAAAGGGIWRTDDALAASVAWTPTTAGLTTGAFGSLVVDPTDRTGNTLYAGSGKPNGSSDSEAGVGLFRFDRRWEDVVASSRAAPRSRTTAPSARSRSTPATGRCGSAPTSHATARRRPTAAGARRPARRSSASTSPPTTAPRSRSRSRRPRARRTRRRAPTSSRAASTRSSSTRAIRARSTPRSSATASGARRRASSAATRRVQAGLRHAQPARHVRRPDRVRPRHDRRRQGPDDAGVRRRLLGRRGHLRVLAQRQGRPAGGEAPRGGRESRAGRCCRTPLLGAAGSARTASARTSAATTWASTPIRRTRTR